MERPAGFIETFTVADLEAEIANHEKNIGSIDGALQGQLAVRNGLHTQLRDAKRANPVDVDLVKRIHAAIEAASGAIQSFQTGVNRIREQQQQNRVYVEYLLWLQSPAAVNGAHG